MLFHRTLLEKARLKTLPYGINGLSIVDLVLIFTCSYTLAGKNIEWWWQVDKKSSFPSLIPTSITLINKKLPAGQHFK